jgi:DNA-binding LytR/AlgR family response regulator
MNCMIVDDDEMSSNILQQLISQISYLKLVKVCKCPLEALDVLKSEDVDLLFLDVEMPAMSGIDMIKSLDSAPPVILTTAHTQYALEGFENNVVDYLVKPVGLSRLLRATEKARLLLMHPHRHNHEFNSEYLFLKKNSVLHKVHVKSIQWIEALGDYVTIHTPETNYTIHLTLKALEAKLPSDKFIRLHRSFIIQLEHITSIDDNVICMGTKLIPVGSLYKDEFMLRLNLLK